MARGNLIALDYGRRRVGVAGCSGDVPIAFGITTLEINGLEDLPGKLKPILTERDVKEIIIGFPLTLGDRLGDLSGEILKLRRLLQAEGLSVRLVDEALSSRKANDLLHQRRRRIKKPDRDRTSAALILQEYLDGHLPPLPESQTIELEKQILPGNKL